MMFFLFEDKIVHEAGMCINEYSTLYLIAIIFLIYSSPSLSGHSHQKPPSLMWPQIFAAALILPLTKCLLSNVATISWQIGWPY